MAKKVDACSDAVARTRNLCLSVWEQDPLATVSTAVLGSVDTSTPFLIDANGWPIEVANQFLRAHANHATRPFGARVSSPNTLDAMAKDLAYFISTYSDRVPVGRDDCATTLNHFRGQLEQSTLAASTCSRRVLYAEEFLTHLAAVPLNDFGQMDSVGEFLRTSQSNLSGQRINISPMHLGGFGRRRHPDTLQLLDPSQLRDFFDEFSDPILSVAPKIIYGTGARVSEVAGIRAGAVAKLRPIAPGGPSKLRVVGKGRKARHLEIESSLVTGLKRFLTSKARMNRALKYASKHGVDPYSDSAPLLIDRFGNALSAEAITDAFRRASQRCNIWRTPHELRHEFAVQYLLNAYRAIAGKLNENNLDAWLARIMIDKAPVALIRLSNLLGHSSVETTRKQYLKLLIDADPAIRGRWNDHLDAIDLGNL